MEKSTITLNKSRGLHTLHNDKRETFMLGVNALYKVDCYGNVLSEINIEKKQLIVFEYSRFDDNVDMLINPIPEDFIR